MGGTITLPRTVALGAALTAGLAAMAAGPTESGGMDKAGGVYSYVPTQDAAACAIACAKDQICLAWSFNANEYVGCSLKAIVPATAVDKGVQSGVAERAAAFLALTSMNPPAETPAPSAAEAKPPEAEPQAASGQQAAAEPTTLFIEPVTEMAMAAPFERISANPLTERAALAWIEPPALIEDQTLETPSLVQFAAITRLPTTSARALPQRADLTWNTPQIAEPLTVEAPTLLQFASFTPPPAFAPRTLGAPTTLQAAIAPEFFDPTIETATFTPLSTEAPLDRVRATPLTTQVAVVFRAPPTIDEPAPQPTQMALLSSYRPATPPAPSAEAFLASAPADAALEEELLGGPDTP